MLLRNKLGIVTDRQLKQVYFVLDTEKEAIVKPERVLFWLYFIHPQKFAYFTQCENSIIM